MKRVVLTGKNSLFVGNSRGWRTAILAMCSTFRFRIDSSERGGSRSHLWYRERSGGGCQERHRKQFANTIVLATVLIAAVAPALLTPRLPAQSAPSKGMDPKLLARANAGDAYSEYLVGFAYEKGVGVPQDLAEKSAISRLTTVSVTGVIDNSAPSPTMAEEARLLLPWLKS